MADSAVAITAGSGTSIDTRTEATNGQHRQVVVLGDPSLNNGVAAVDATNGLSVNVTNASLTVASHAVTNAGTFATQAASTQSGTWTVQPGNTANTTAWKVDGSAVTQPVSVASIPSHAVTNVGTFAVQAAATLAAETTKVIGTVNIASSQLGTLGSATSANSVPVVMATDQKFFANTYETIAAGVTAQVMGGSGATGDYVSGVLVIPGTTSPGNVLLLDNATSITIFTGGATSVSNLVPFFIPLGMVSQSGAWKITTGSNVTAICMGSFT